VGPTSGGEGTQAPAGVRDARLTILATVWSAPAASRTPRIGGQQTPKSRLTRTHGYPETEQSNSNEPLNRFGGFHAFGRRIPTATRAPGSVTSDPH